jgi:ferredoxin
VCPSGALATKAIDLSALLDRLQQHPNPVLGCHRQPGVQAHEKTECLGWLGEEYLIVLLVTIQDGVQLNAIPCSNCQNGFIVDELKTTLEAVAAKIDSDLFLKIRLVEDNSQLDYQKISYNRRSFFRLLQQRTAQEVGDIINHNSGRVKSLAYNQKTLSDKKRALNSALSASLDKIRQNIVAHYYFDVGISEQCTRCAACTAVCPTGALWVEENRSEEEFLFDPSRCHGCGLCAEFCTTNAIQVKKGLSGELT